MLILPGAIALSDFRINRLTSRLQKSINTLKGLKSRYVHFIDFEGEPDDEQLSRLKTLLDYGPEVQCGTKHILH